MWESERKRRKKRGQSLKKLTVRAGGIAQRLGGLVALAEDPVAIPSSQITGVQHPLPTPQAMGIYMLHTHTHIHADTTYIYMHVYAYIHTCRQNTHMHGTKINKCLFFLKAAQSGQVRSFCRC